MSFRVTKFPSCCGSKFPIKREGGPMRSLGTDYVITGPMRGLKKTESDGANRQIEKQTNMATL